MRAGGRAIFGAMIRAVRGRLVEKRPDFAAVDVGGVVFGLAIPLSTFERLPSEGGEVLLHTHLVHGEDRMDLYGFADAEAAEVFRTLLGVSGIGPKMALAVLSRLPPAELEAAVAAQDVARLKSIGGIGPKTAEKIVFELKDKVARRPGRTADGSGGSVEADLRLALQSLGYSASEIDRAVSHASVRQVAALEEKIRAALAVLAGGR